MRSRYKVGLSMALAVAMLPMTSSADVVDRVVRQLKEQGYTRIEISRTWLGRAKIEAVRGNHEREIVLNRNTGEILRDYWEREDEEDGPLLGSHRRRDAEVEAPEEDDHEEDDHEDDHDEEDGEEMPDDEEEDHEDEDGDHEDEEDQDDEDDDDDGDWDEEDDDADEEDEDDA